MNIKDFGDVNERLQSSPEVILSGEIVGFLAFALTIMILSILFILLG